MVLFGQFDGRSMLEAVPVLDIARWLIWLLRRPLARLLDDEDLQVAEVSGLPGSWDDLWVSHLVRAAVWGLVSG